MQVKYGRFPPSTDPKLESSILLFNLVKQVWIAVRARTLLDHVLEYDIRLR